MRPRATKVQLVTESCTVTPTSATSPADTGRVTLCEQGSVVPGDGKVRTFPDTRNVFLHLLGQRRKLHAPQQHTAGLWAPKIGRVAPRAGTEIPYQQRALAGCEDQGSRASVPALGVIAFESPGWHRWALLHLSARAPVDRPGGRVAGRSKEQYHRLGAADHLAEDKTRRELAEHKRRRTRYEVEEDASLLQKLPRRHFFMTVRREFLLPPAASLNSLG